MSVLFSSRKKGDQDDLVPGAALGSQQPYAVLQAWGRVGGKLPGGKGPGGAG